MNGIVFMFNTSSHVADGQLHLLLLLRPRLPNFCRTRLPHLIVCNHTIIQKILSSSLLSSIFVGKKITSKLLTLAFVYASLLRGFFSSFFFFPTTSSTAAPSLFQSPALTGFTFRSTGNPLTKLFRSFQVSLTLSAV